MLWSKPVDAAERDQDCDSAKGDVILKKFEPDNIFRAGDEITQAGPATER